MCDTAGSAAAPAARWRNLRRGSFISNLPSHHSITSSARGRARFRLADPAGLRETAPTPHCVTLGARPNSARGGTVFGANEVQVADDFVAAAMVRRMIDAVDHRHVGKIKRAHAL